MNSVLELLHGPLSYRLGWTLLHFLWQGALLAGLFAVARFSLRSASANARYLAGCTALFLMVLVLAVTFAGQKPFQTAAAPAAASATGTAAVGVSKPVDIIRVSAIRTQRPRVQAGLWEQLGLLANQLERALPWLVAAWMLGVWILSLRLAAGWLKVRSLKIHSHQPVSEEWLQKLQALKQRMCISRPVRLVQSWAVDVPTIIGWLKPVVLFPVSTLTGLGPAQVETLLAHELAHVRRHDYLVNLLQCAVETLLFYHPAVWWVGRCIRQERENCCDDLTVQVCGDPLQYARALATLEELRNQPVALVLAANGKPLLRRIQRLLSPDTTNNSTVRAGSGFFTLLLLLTILVTLPLACSQKAPATGDVKTLPEQTVTMATNKVQVKNPASSESRTNLYTRVFIIDSNIFINAVMELAKTEGIQTKQEQTPGEHGLNSVRSRRAEFTNAGTELADDTFELVFETIKTIGFDPSAPGRSMYIEFRIGTLMIRGTLQELDRFEKSLKILNQAPPQVVFACKFVEIREDKQEPFSLRKMLQPEEIYQTANAFRFTSKSVHLFGQGDGTYTESDIATNLNFSPPSLAILTDAQYQRVIKALESRNGSDVLTSPKVVTLSDRQAQLKVVDVKTIVNRKELLPDGTLTTEQVELGPVLDVVGHVLDDKATLDVSATGRIKEFLGYRNLDDSNNPAPVFRERMVSAPARVWDGQTIVLDGGAVVIEEPNSVSNTHPGTPVAEPLFQPENDTRKKHTKRLLIFITPTLIDAAGNRMHANEDMPYSHNTVPPQKYN